MSAAFGVAWFILVTLLASGCASRDVPSIGAGGQPFQPEADERQLWAQAAREEAALVARVTAHDDPLLAEYLATLGARLTPDPVRAAGGPTVTFRVLRDPALNAFAMPGGRVYVHTGLLARVENESQLATILGREIAHVTRRHALRVARDAIGGQIRLTAPAVAASIGVAVAAGTRAEPGDGRGTAVIGRTATAILGLGLQLSALAAIEGYGRDLEREADETAMESLVRAGYDPGEAPKVFALLRADAKDRGSLETFFLGRDRRLGERFETTGRILRTRFAGIAGAPSAVRDTEEFQLRMRPVVRENAHEDIRAGRFALARRQLDRVLAVTPGDALAHLRYGDLHRLRSQREQDHAARAASAREARARYEQASALDPALAEAHRQLGLLHYQQGDTASAKAAFRRYLALRPDAPDAARITDYLVGLER